MLSELIHDGDGLFVSSGVAEPARLIDELLEQVAPQRRDLSLFEVFTGSQGRLLEARRYGHRLTTVAPGPLREAVATGEVRLLDLSMRQCAQAIEDGRIPVDSALLSAVQVDDRLLPVPASDLAIVAFERARFRAVELLPGWPVAPVGPSFARADVDYVVEGSGTIAELQSPTPTELSRTIGRLVAELVPAHAIVEMGVGAAIASVAECLVAARRPLSVHSGLVSDWVRELIEGGVACEPLPCADGRPVVAAVAMGSEGFQRWLGESSFVAFAESRHAHDPAHLASLGTFVAINSAAAVDLGGQVGASGGGASTSAPGGLLDFAIAGAYSGLSIVALSSTARDGSSRIRERLGAVHLPGSLVTHVVTEHGVADLRGSTSAERREALIAIAHPDHRAALREGGSSRRLRPQRGETARA